MARGPLGFIGGLLEGLASLPEQLFGGGGLGGLLEGLFGGRSRGRSTPGSQKTSYGQQFTSFPEPAPKFPEGSESKPVIKNPDGSTSK